MSDPSFSSPPPPRPFGEYLRIVTWKLLPWAGVLLLGGLLIGFVYSRIKQRKATIQESLQAEEGARETERVNVVTWKIRPVLLVDDIQLPGLVQPWEDLTLAAEVNGRIVECLVEEGAIVRAGDPIARVDDRDYRIALSRAQAALSVSEAGILSGKAGQTRAQAALTLARQSLDRARALLEKGAMTRAELDSASSGHDQSQANFLAAEAVLAQAEGARLEAQSALEAARLSLQRCTILAPFSGLVNHRFISLGTLVKPGDAVAEILDIHKVRIAIGIPEADVERLRTLSEVELRVDALGGRAFVGQKTFLSLKPLAGTQVYQLRLEVENAEALLRPGMFVDATVVRRRAPEAVVVPLFAVVVRGGEPFCYVLRDGKAEKRVVRLGLTKGRDVEILTGLAAGDELIVMGQRQVENAQEAAVVQTLRDFGELYR
ncbi:MAG: efflux RND transporter periplasmic adaptor subunit [Planctomycetota bacterium]